MGMFGLGPGGWARALGDRLSNTPPILVPLILVIAGTVVFCAGGWDTRFVDLFYSHGERAWPVGDELPWRWLYDVGPLPGLVLGIGGLAVAGLALVAPRLRRWQRMGCFLALSLALGPGLIVNGLLKPHWDRPRPSQLAAFGGSSPYAPVWSPGTVATGTSFPSGHASMGFFLMVPGFLAYRRNRRLARLLFTFGLLAGVLIGMARIVQGRHFPSDVLWSAACVYYSSLVLYLLFRFDRVPAPHAGIDGSEDKSAPLPAPAQDGDFREAA
jgi:membrane-associated PAP2 superfamily phosphatase